MGPALCTEGHLLKILYERHDAVWHMAAITAVTITTEAGKYTAGRIYKAVTGRQ